MGTKQMYFSLPAETVLHHFKLEQTHTAAVEGNRLLSYLCSTLIAPLVLLLLSLSQSPNLHGNTRATTISPAKFFPAWNWSGLSRWRSNNRKDPQLQFEKLIATYSLTPTTAMDMWDLRPQTHWLYHLPFTSLHPTSSLPPSHCHSQPCVKTKLGQEIPAANRGRL